MKKSLTEELKRIHTITYGKEIIEEGFLDNVLRKVGIKKDPKKADVVEPDVEKFFDTLETAAKGNGITQQEKGSMTFQKEVESMQIGLILLGYELPKYGVDGLFGPETASVVQSFKRDNLFVNEGAQELRSTLSSLGYKEKSGQLSSGGDISDELSNVVGKILKDFKQQKPDVEVILTSGNDLFHKKLGYKSKHTLGQAVDLVLKPYNTENANAFKSILNKYKSEDGNFNYIDEYINPSSSSTGGHFHLQYGKGTGTSVTGEIATPEMLNKLIELLKERGVTEKELNQLSNIDIVNYSGGTGNEFYSKLLESLRAPITEENMKFLFAWRQAEGRGGKNNPFNTTWDLPGSTIMNDAGVRNYNSAQEGLIATIKTLKNPRYSCIVDGLRNDIGADKIAQCESLKTWGTGDLVAKVISGYNKGYNPKVPPL
jgi:peptidoglycan hydrolase-like protein with peptidoglycan-binding domain